MFFSNNIFLTRFAFKMPNLHRPTFKMKQDSDKIIELKKYCFYFYDFRKRRISFAENKRVGEKN